MVGKDRVAVGVRRTEAAREATGPCMDVVPRAQSPSGVMGVGVFNGLRGATALTQWWTELWGLVSSPLKHLGGARGCSWQGMEGKQEMEVAAH